jgi:UMF1 family MFS transporter
MNAQAEHKPALRGSRREIFGWCMFDFANSSYTTIIITAVFSAYFIETVAGGGEPAALDGVDPAPSGGTRGDFLWGLSVFISLGMVLVTAPILGAIADFTAAKKRFLFLSYLACVVTTALLFFVREGDIALGMTLFIISNFFYSMGENLVSGFLPDLAPPERMASLSGYAWALGYFGGLGSLLACRPLLEDHLPWAFPVTAAFFLAGGIPTFVWVRERGSRQAMPPGENLFTMGFRRVRQTLGRVRHFRQLFRFLVIFCFYNAGVMIVVTFAVPFARREIGMSGEQVTNFMIVLQISAALGAFLFGLLQDRAGARRTLMITIVIWIGVTVGAYFVTSVAYFYVIGNAAGMAMGAIQSGSRALVGIFSPEGRSAEFFGFWGLSWKLSGACGPLFFGTVAQWHGYRPAILWTSCLFLGGLIGLAFVDEKEGRRAAEAAEERGQSSSGSE